MSPSSCTVYTSSLGEIVHQCVHPAFDLSGLKPWPFGPCNFSKSFDFTSALGPTDKALVSRDNDRLDVVGGVSVCRWFAYGSAIVVRRRSECCRVR